MLEANEMKVLRKIARIRSSESDNHAIFNLSMRGQKEEGNWTKI